MNGCAGWPSWLHSCALGTAALGHSSSVARLAARRGKRRNVTISESVELIYEQKPWIWQTIRRPPFRHAREAIVNVMDRFAAMQLACYIASCISMFFYALHFSSGLPIAIRIYTHNACEILLLVFRGLNEVIHGKIDRNDIMHHSMFIVGSWIVFNVRDCDAFGFLLSHMQCLHFPMTLWYAGGRRSLAGTGHSRFQQVCVATFPTLWLLCVAYRTTMMTCSLYLSLGRLPISVSITFLVLLLMITSIDHSWTSYFFNLLGRPSKTALALSMISGAALGALVLSLPST